MRPEQHEEIVEPSDPELPDLGDYTSYEDGDGYVICDKRNAKAWIRSDVTETIPR